MGFVGLHFHNTSASMTLWHMSLKKILFFFFFLQKYNKYVHVSSKAYIDTLSIFMTRVGLSTSLDPQVSHAFISLFMPWILIQ